jgi:hypothetical protein
MLDLSAQLINCLRVLLNTEQAVISLGLFEIFHPKHQVPAFGICEGGNRFNGFMYHFPGNPFRLEADGLIHRA